ncbi:MAG: class I SAM-dependent methyltransferase [Candidatus Pacebacteria bacterium]|nr:class I SAM-dependent methyltransferase [Candidatus Paceibacterota bacterium]
MKLERYGDSKTGIKVARPDPQALWRKSLSEKEWKQVDAYFTDGKVSAGEQIKIEREGMNGADVSSKDTSKNRVKGANAKNEAERGKWIITRPQLPESWNINFGDLNFNIKLTSFKHTGIFPEQHNNWLWCREIIKDAVRTKDASSPKPTVLNLFGYTGGATISAALGGAEVTHVDASRSSVTWANENAKASHLEDAPIRWILDDALAFVRRELRRGKKYDAIIMDPPAFGRGAKGEIWKIEDDFLDLFETCLQLLTDNPLFVVLNGYAAGYSSIAYENNMQSLVRKYAGTVESGELALREEGPAGRLLPCGIVSRWKKS